MRILHLTTFLQGGAGGIITALAIAQRRARHDVIVVGDGGGEPGYSTYREYVEALRTAGVEYQTVTSTFKRDLALNLQASQELRLLLANGCDLVHAHAAVPGLVARLALGRHAAPIVHTMHGWGVGKSPEHARTDVALLNLADAVVTPSQAAERHLKTLGVRDVEVIRYGIPDSEPDASNVDAADRARVAELRRNGASIALCTGTIGARKNQRLLVDAITDARLQRLHAIFIGDGDTDALSAHAAANGVGDRVHVLGYRPRAARYLVDADVFVLPSRNEGLPIAVLEALRAGTPVVASAIPEIAEAIEDVPGALFEPDSATALANALVETLSRSDGERQTLVRRLRESFRSRYRETRMIDAFDELYARVGEPAGRPASR